MKVSIHSNKKISLHCTIDNNNVKDFSINRKRTLILSNDIKKIRFNQYNPRQNTNVFGFVFLAVIIAFLETQKTFEKGISYLFMILQRNVLFVIFRYIQTKRMK